MHRSSSSAVLLFAGLLAASGCESPAGSLANDVDLADLTVDIERPDDAVDEPRSSAYVLAPEFVAVFVGEAVDIDVELLEPDMFALRPGAMPPSATFTELDSGARVHWEPTLSDIGTHEFVLLVVDAEETNLVISQEMFAVDVNPRLRFIEYGF